MKDLLKKARQKKLSLKTGTKWFSLARKSVCTSQNKGFVSKIRFQWTTKKLPLAEMHENK